MRAKDIMSAKVVTASPKNSIRHAAQIMLDNGVSGLPVVDDNACLVGIISEGDLLRRTELGTSSFLAADQSAASREDRASAYVKGHSWNVGDVMSAPAVTVDEGAPAGRVAALMDEHRIKRVVVTRDGQPVGIVSRADLLRAIVAAKSDDSAPGDAAIRRSVLARLGDETGLDDAQLSVTVSNGVVHISGIVGSESEREAARVVAEGIRGVAGVADHLRVVPGAREKTARVEDGETICSRPMTVPHRGLCRPGH